MDFLRSEKNRNNQTAKTIMKKASKLTPKEKPVVKKSLKRDELESRPYYANLPKRVIAVDKEYREIIGVNVKAIREHKGWTQRQASEITGMSRTRICELEIGRWSSTMIVLIQVADAFGVQVEELLDRSTHKRFPSKMKDNVRSTGS